MYVPDKDFLKPRVLVRSFCRNIYGVGKERTNFLLRIYGLYGNVEMKEVVVFFYKKLVGYIDLNYLTEKSLSNLVFSRLKMEKDLLTVRGFKLNNNLPINGQRTHTNANTASRLGFEYHIASNKERRKSREPGRQLYLVEDSKARRKGLRKYFKNIKNKKRGT